MKKRMGYFIICLLLILVCAFPAHAVGSEGEQVQLSVDFGIYYAVKSGRYVPVHITVEKLGEFKEGTLEIRVPVTSHEQYVYESNILLKQRATQNIYFYIPIYADTKYLEIGVFDEEGNCVLTHRETMILQDDYGEIFTGILDRLENDESRLNNLIIDDNSDISIKEFHITTDSFPENVLDLNLLDMIIVNPSAEKILTLNKKRILEQWVDQGGLCIFNESSNDGYEPLGNGGFYYCSENLFQKDEESLRDIFFKIINKDRLEKIQNDMMMRMDSDYWEINDLVNVSAHDSTASLYLYIGLLILYLITVCPAVFLFLRKKRKSVHYSYVVIGSACLFSLIIIMAGSRTRVYQPIVNFCKIINLGRDQISQDVYIGIKSPNNKENEMRTDASYTILPVQNGFNSYYPMGENNIWNEPDNYNLKMEIDDDYNTIKIKNKKAFDTSLFHLNKSCINVEKQTLSASLHIFDNKVSGQVTNNTGKDLEDVFIAGFNQFYYIGSMKNGETTELDQEPLTHYTVGYFHTISQFFQKKQERTISYFLSSCFSEPINQFKIAGFAEDEDEFPGENTFQAKGTVLVNQNCEVDFTEGDQIFCPVLQERPAVISGNYRYKSFMMESESCVVNYNLGRDFKVDYITFYENNCGSEEGVSYRKSFSGFAYFMNWETGRYEEKAVPGVFSADQLEPYLNDSNQIQVKYVDHAYGNKVYGIGIPYLTVTGRE